jgi:hypothetical protein
MPQDCIELGLRLELVHLGQRSSYISLSKPKLTERLKARACTGVEDAEGNAP